MIIAAAYYFKGSQNTFWTYKNELAEVGEIIRSVDSAQYKTKQSQEKTMLGTMLYDPVSLNDAFEQAFTFRKWEKKRILCEYSSGYYLPYFKSKTTPKRAFREMDFVKNRVGVEVQFGKYAFMVYNVCAKMTIFHKKKYIDVGIEIVPIKEFADQMSTGVSYFEQLVWDLEERGIADIDIPVLILGVSE